MLFLRLVCLMLIAVGGALGIFHPWYQANHSSRELGTWRVFDGDVFHAAETRAGASDAPLTLTVEMVTRGPLHASRQGAILTVITRNGGRTVLEQGLDFDGVTGRTLNPQTGAQAYRTRVGRIAEMSAGELVVTLERGADRRAELLWVDLTIETAPAPVQRNAIPIGYVLLGIGFVCLVLTFRGRPRRKPAGPPPPRWGRQ